MEIRFQPTVLTADVDGDRAAALDDARELAAAIDLPQAAIAGPTSLPPTKQQTKGTTMARIPLLDPTQADDKNKDLLNAVQAKLGTTPNMMKAMAGSTVLEGYLGLSSALGSGRIRPAIAERIALAVGEANECSYCLSVHSYLAEHMAKIDAEEIGAARAYGSSDPNAQAALRFAEAVVAGRGDVDADAFNAARAAGLTDADLAEIVGHVALNVLTNYFNRAFEIDVDFPAVTPNPRVAA